MFLKYCSVSLKLSVILLLMTSAGFSSASTPSKRVPAEWEPQEAIWIQWPGRYEKVFEPAFAKIASIIVEYETLHILHHNNSIIEEARSAISRAGGNPDHPNINWHRIANDSAWMRDNGPVYVIEDGAMRIQNWEFNAWGGGFGADIPFRHDNNIPDAIGELTGLPVDHIDIVHERGNLEFNGTDTVILNWSTIGDPGRNPGYTIEQATSDMQRHFGVSKVIFIEGIPEGDRTRGHIDGIARFINRHTVVIPQCTGRSLCQPGDGRDSLIFDNAARVIAEAGFNVVRDPIEGAVSYKGVRYDTNYMNWLVGNGFVIAVGFDNPATDNAARQRIRSYFPDREIHIIEMLGSWHSGGGIHCHTNDQPAMSTINFRPE